MANEMEKEKEANHLLEQMCRANEMISANKISTKLASRLFDICKKLKICGKGLEEAHRGDLDTFFASIRQVNCRENDELGLPCRLKLMELLELRGMGWRTNLSHAQFYAKREREMAENSITNKVMMKRKSEEKSSPPSSIRSSVEPLSPTFVSNNPMAKGVGMSNSSPENISSAVLKPFVPSANAAPFVPNFPPPNSVNLFSSPSPSQFVPFTPRDGHFPFNFYQNQQQKMSTIGRCFVPNLLEGIELIGNGNDGGIIPFPAFEKISNRFHQFREEITIKNADSGKVMGVKGRRVALIEEISKTVISFQKVDQKSKDRQLTIIGESKGAIEGARKLIAEIIERNVSPERPTEKIESANEKQDGEDAGKEAGKEAFSSAEKNGDGTWKIGTEDETLLEAIRDALNEHLLKSRTEKNGSNRKSDQSEKEKDGRKCDQKSSIEEERMSNVRNSGESNSEKVDRIQQNVQFVYERGQLLRIREMHNNDGIGDQLARKLIECDLFNNSG